MVAVLSKHNLKMFVNLVLICVRYMRVLGHGKFTLDTWVDILINLDMVSQHITSPYPQWVIRVKHTSVISDENFRISRVIVCWHEIFWIFDGNELVPSPHNGTW